MSLRVPIHGRDGMVVCDHHLAALEAWQALRDGGSFVDAAIAAAAVQTVVLPQACTLGGDAFALTHEAGMGTRALNASGRSPAALHTDVYAEGIPRTGPLTVSVPGVVGGWEALHQAYGKLPWRRVLGPAARLAGEGFTVSAGLAEASQNAAENLGRDPGCSQIFLSDSKPLTTGQTLRQPALARVLDEIITKGARAGFYEGRAGSQIAGTLHRLGAAMSPDDFAAFAPEWNEPLSVDFRDMKVLAAPPNSFGVFMLLQLGLRERLLGNCAALDEGALTLNGITISRLAFAAADRIVADAPDADSQARALIGASRLDDLANHHRDEPLKAPTRDAGGTSIVLVADSAGNGVCIVQSVFMPFGSAVTDPETGILLNNRMIGFHEPGDHPNAIGPAKRPAHTLNPCIVTSPDGCLLGLLGTPGGPGQTLTLTQVLSGLFAEGLPPGEVVDRPRWSTDLTGSCLFEPGFPEAVLARVRDGGIPARVTEGTEPFYGAAQVILRDLDGLLSGAADARREAHVLGI